ncbi:MAG: type II and III secretion system protein family protein [Pseudomonadota bacterium]
MTSLFDHPVGARGGVACALGMAALALAWPCSGAARPKALPAAPQPHQQGEPARGGPQCRAEVGAPTSLRLALGKSTLMHLPEPLANRTVGNPAIVQAMLVGPQTLYLVGAEIGSTNMILESRGGRCSVVEVMVGIDPAALQASLQALLPEERNIKVGSAGDTLVLSGSVADGATVNRALELAAAFVRRPGGGAGAPAAGGGAEAATGQGAARVVNLLSVSAPQQVMLEVKIAEVSKSLLERLEAGANLRLSSGSWAATLLSNFITGKAGAQLEAHKSNGNSLALEAQKQDGLVRILAEPTVMAISGQEGSFLAGGKILIPVGQDTVGNAVKITLEEKEFGVGLRFTPTVLAGGRINLKVAPEVSELSRDGVGISAAGVGGGTAVLPLITTRRAATTVQLFDGQSFAIGGLIRNNVTANIKGLPLLGDIPILGALFRSTDFQQDKTELVFVVTPHLVKPLGPDYTLPTDRAPEPSRADVLLGGRLEGSAPAPRTPGFELK